MCYRYGFGTDTHTYINLRLGPYNDVYDALKSKNIGALGPRDADVKHRGLGFVLPIDDFQNFLPFSQQTFPFCCRS